MSGRPTRLPAEVPERPLMTYGAAAELLETNRRRISAMVAEGELAAVQLPTTTGPKGRRILRSSVERLLADWERRASA
jgi:excisionase family DNA binding protein